MPTIREAKANDCAAIESLLREQGLRTEGLLNPDTKYWICEARTEIVGSIGLELGDTVVQLRSAIVAPGRRGDGVGRALTETALGWARANSYKGAYCFSTDAAQYWIARGFCRCTVEEVVLVLPSAPHVLLFGRLGCLPTEVTFRFAIEN